MKFSWFNLQTTQYWMVRLSASDPGLIRLKFASRAVISVILAVSVMAIINHFFAHAPITVAILAGVLGMISTVAVNDDTVKQKKTTTLLLPFSSALALTVSSVLGRYSHYFVDLYLLIIVFLALFLQQFRMRYFSLCMVSFISIYFSALLHIKSSQLTWFYVAIVIGITMAFIVNFILFTEKPDKTLERCLSSFHIQINLTLDLIIEMIEDFNPNQHRLKQLENSTVKLSEYARMVSDQFKSANPGKIWPGLQPQQLRLYIFDSTMLMQTLFPAIKRLKELHALEHVEVRSFLIQLMKALRKSNVLSKEFDMTELVQAEAASLELKQQLGKLKAGDSDYMDWLYLLRRIQSIARHIIGEIADIQKTRLSHTAENTGQIESENEEKNNEVENNQKERKKGLQPATKKAFQAVAAGIVSILLGYTLTPSHQYWILLSGFVVFFGTETAGNTIIKAINRFAGTLFGAIVGFGLDHLITGLPFVEIPLLFLCIFMGFYLIPISYALMIFWITMLLAIMYNLLLGGISEQLLLSRVVDTLIGAGLGASATAFLFPIRTKDKVRDTMVGFFTLLKENVTAHLDKFKNLEVTGTQAHQAFELDQKLQMVKNDADPLTKRPGYLGRSGIEHQLTVLTAMNYYAKHLVASTNRTQPQKVNKRIVETIKLVNICLTENIDTLCRLFQDKEKKQAVVWDLKEEREQIERSPDRNKENGEPTQLIYDLYYIWRINKAILSLAEDMGAQVQKKQKKPSDS
ncbi:MAG TPA: FUSC family protein [Bacillales bacterium]|nr:FUSC family protein [Bacillales bacterium]